MAGRKKARNAYTASSRSLFMAKTKLPRQTKISIQSETPPHIMPILRLRWCHRSCSRSVKCARISVTWGDSWIQPSRASVGILRIYAHRHRVGQEDAGIAVVRAPASCAPEFSIGIVVQIAPLLLIDRIGLPISLCPPNGILRVSIS